MGKIIMVASGKGGTGKTTVVSNIGTALSKQGKLTVLVDMDVGLRNLDIALGLENNIVYDICDVLENSCTIDDALVKDPENDNLYILCSPQTKYSIEFQSDNAREMCDSLRNRFDYCIIDAPAGVGESFLQGLEASDEVIIIATPEIAALRDADRTVDLVSERKECSLILNRVRAELIEEGIMMNVDECIDMIGIPILGIVPEDGMIERAALRGKSIVYDSPAATAFSNIARRIIGEEVPVMDFKIEKKGFFKRLGELFKG